MKTIQYDVVIRSLGNLKYLEPTLVSLRHQSLRPSEIVVVIPHGMPHPTLDDTSLVRFEGGRKGMITQRADGIKQSDSRFQLLIDDDIIFKDPYTVERLFEVLIAENAVCVCPLLDLPRGPVAIPLALFGIAVPWFKPRLKHNAGGGFMYPVGKRNTGAVIQADGGRGACLMTDGDFIKKHGLFGDEWFDRAGYAFRDDAAFVYDITRHGGGVLMVDAGTIEHIGVNPSPTRKSVERRTAAQIVNSHYFWKTYILPTYRFRLWPKVAFAWTVVGYLALGLALGIRRLSFAPIRGSLKGCWHVMTSRHGS